MVSVDDALDEHVVTACKATRGRGGAFALTTVQCTLCTGHMCLDGANPTCASVPAPPQQLTDNAQQNKWRN